MRRTLRASLLLIFIVAMAVSARAETSGHIKVVTEQWPPYNFEQGGEVRGVATELVRAALDRSGFSYDVRVYPWARAYQMAKNEENVLIYVIFRLPSREKDFKWVKLAGLSTNMYLFSPKHRDDVKVESLEDGKKYRVGVTRDSSTHHFLRSNGYEDGANLFPVHSEELNILKSDPKRNRIDLTTGDRLSMGWWLKASGLPSDYWREELELFREEFFLAFGHRTSDKVVRAMRLALEDIRRDGTYDRIVEKYWKMFE